jgi:hypothetical protein
VTGLTLPPEIPRRWARAAATWLAEGNADHHERVAALLVELGPRLRKIERRALRRQLELGRGRRGARRELTEAFRTILVLLVAKGGWQPAVSARELKERRETIAAAVRRLAAALDADPYAGELALGAFLNAAGVEHRTSDHRLAWAFATCRMAPTLRNLATNVEAGVALDLFGRDALIMSEGAYRGRFEQRRRLEQSLQRELCALTGRPCDDFVAAAVNAVFATDEPVTASEVGARRRNRRPQ